MDTDDLLKMATKEKQSGNYEQACIYLKQAYTTMDQSPVWYPVETYLRLPSYLQMAGKPKEAWEAFEQLIKVGYPHQPTAPGLKAFDLNHIFDKMRLFLQREKQWQEAAIYGICAFIMKREAYKKQGREKEIAFEDSIAGKTNLIKTIANKAFFSLSIAILDAELKAISNQQFYDRPIELIATIRGIVPKCIDGPQAKNGFDDNKLRELISSQWLLMPEIKAFKQIFSLLRKLIQGKTKLNLDVKEEIKELYKVAVFYELLFETNLVKPTVKVKGIMPSGQKHVAYSIACHADCSRLYQQLEADYRLIGYKHLTALNKKDILIIERALGQPLSNIKPRSFYEKLWLEMVQSYEDRVIEYETASRKSFEEGFQEIMKLFNK